MSMTALPPEECQEILALFREKLPNIPDILRQELAAQYRKDALADVDPMDIIEAIAEAKRIERIEILAPETEPLLDAFNRLVERCRNALPQATGAFLTVSGPSARFREYGDLLTRFHRVFDENVSRLSALYVEPRPRPESRLRLLLTAKD